MSDQTKIFVGSSSEQMALANRICAHLHESGFSPLLWTKAFAIGDITMHALLREARGVQGAIFLFTKDDEITTRKEKMKITRDNVIFEAGMFTSILGTRRAVVFVERGAKVPSDFFGVTVKFFNPEFPLLDELVEHFRTEIESAPFRKSRGDVPVYQDNELTRALLNSDEYPKDWTQRLVYIGRKGAKNWLNVAQGSNYSGRMVVHETRRAIKEAVSNIENARVFVSFGPGDGSLDQELVAVLSNRFGALTYIPADINVEFVKRTIMQMPASVHVPFGLVVDFEERLEFALDKAVQDDLDGNIIFSLLGYTLANLEHAESTFVAGVRDRMRKGDYLLMDLQILGPNWSEEGDPVTKPKAYSSEYKTFFATAISRRRGECFHEVMRDFDSRMICEISSRSDVRNSKVLLVVDSKTGLELFKFTRYDFASFREWLSGLRLEIVFEKITVRDSVADFGVILAKKM